MLLDADRYGGGIDLLLGAERVDGWRWPRLARASGHLGDLGGQLPTVDGIDVLAMARTGHPPGWELTAEPLRAVLGSARRGYEVTIVDLPRGAGPAVQEALRLADLVVLLLRDDSRGVAAGRELLAVIEESRCEVGLVLRQSRSRMLKATVVAEGLGLRLLGTLADDPALIVAAERGDPPGRSVRSRWPSSAANCSGELAARASGRVAPVARMITESELVALDPIRDRLAGLGRSPTPADVAIAMREAGLVLTDTSVIETVEALRRNSVGAGPLDSLLREPGVTDVLVNGPDQVYVDRGAGLELTDLHLGDAGDVRRLAQRLAASVGRRLDDAIPFVDARLAGRHPGPCGARHRCRTRHLHLAPGARPPVVLADRLRRVGIAHAGGAQVLERIVQSRLAFLVSGGTGSGKTTLLAALLGLVPHHERS
jgi:hypothetical protein